MGSFWPGIIASMAKWAPRKGDVGSTASTPAPEDELSDLGQWGEKHTAQSLAALAFNKAPHHLHAHVTCTPTLAYPRQCLRNSTSPRSLSLLCHQREKTLSLLGNRKLL